MKKSSNKQCQDKKI